MQGASAGAGGGRLPPGFGRATYCQHHAPRSRRARTSPSFRSVSRGEGVKVGPRGRSTFVPFFMATISPGEGIGWGWRRGVEKTGWAEGSKGSGVGGNGRGNFSGDHEKTTVENASGCTKRGVHDTWPSDEVVMQYKGYKRDIAGRGVLAR